MWFAPAFIGIHSFFEKYFSPKKTHVIVNLFHMASVFTWNPRFVVSKSYFLADFFLLFNNREVYPGMWHILLAHHVVSYAILATEEDNEDVDLALKWAEVSNMSLAAYELYPNVFTKTMRVIIYPWSRCAMLPLCLIECTKSLGVKAFVLGVPIVGGSFWWSWKILKDFLRK
jgi:hypothetical protein